MKAGIEILFDVTRTVVLIIIIWRYTQYSHKQTRQRIKDVVEVVTLDNEKRIEAAVEEAILRTEARLLGEMEGKVVDITRHVRQTGTESP